MGLFSCWFKAGRRISGTELGDRRINLPTNPQSKNWSTDAACVPKNAVMGARFLEPSLQVGAGHLFGHTHSLAPAQVFGERGDIPEDRRVSIPTITRYLFGQTKHGMSGTNRKEPPL